MALVLPNIEDAPSFDGMAVRDSADFSALGAPGRGSGVVSGMAVTQDTGSNMKVAVASGVISINGVETTYSGTGSPFTVAAASATDRRDAVIYRVGTGVVVLAGTACGTAGWTHTSTGNPPVKPTLTESTDVLLDEIYVAATTTVITTATNLVDKRNILGPSPLASAGAVSQIASNVLGTAAASVTFSSIPSTFNHLNLKGTARGSAADPQWTVTINSVSAGYDLLGSTANTSVTVASNSNAASWSAGVFDLAGTSNAAGVASLLDLTFQGYAKTTFDKTCQWFTSLVDPPSGGLSSINSAQGIVRTSTATVVSSVTAAPTTGNFITGSAFYLYGIT